MKSQPYLMQIKSQFDLKSNKDLAKFLGLTDGRISQLMSPSATLTERLLKSFLKKIRVQSSHIALVGAIKPAIEMYPIERTLSLQGENWELLPTVKNHDVRNIKIRKYLEERKGVYVFFDSQGLAIYVGKTQKQNLWKEMTSAYNRKRSHHTAFLINHPTTGAEFSSAIDYPRQPIEQLVYLHATANYFSAYDVTTQLIPKLEALLVRIFCNSLSNKKMEKF